LNTKLLQVAADAVAQEAMILFLRVVVVLVGF
jgi:hypothetical protein